MGFAGSLLNHSLINDRPIRRKEIESDGSSTQIRVPWTVDLNQWTPIAMAQGQERVEQPGCQTFDAFVNCLHANAQQRQQTRDGAV